MNEVSVEPIKEEAPVEASFKVYGVDDAGVRIELGEVRKTLHPHLFF